MATSADETNRFPVKPPTTINSHQDFVNLRKAWSALPMAGKIVRSRSDVPDISFPGQNTRVLLSGDESAGKLAIFDLYLEPGFGAPKHHQPNEEECFYLIEGELEATVGNVTAVIHPGAFLFAPRNATHSFKNIGDKPAHVLSWNSPAGHERAFAAARRLNEEGKGGDPQARAHVRANHEIIFHDSDALSEIDQRTNRQVEKASIIVNTHDDFVALRQAWAAMPMIPKVVRSREDGAGSTSPGRQRRILLNGEESGGRFSLSDVFIQPGAGAAPHHQPSEEECWYVLDGALEMRVGNETATVSAGAFAFIPRGTTHAFKNIGTTPVHMLAWNSPAGHERGLEIDQRLRAEGRELDKEARRRLFEAHDFIFHDN